MKLFGSILCCWLLFLPVHQARALDSIQMAQIDSMLSMSLEELTDLEVEIATGTSKPINLAPAVASVITAADIEMMGARTMNEALESVPGLHNSMSTNGNRNTWSIRGIHTDLNPQVLFLINGVPFRQLYVSDRGSHFDLPVTAISRIEVMRGPGSAVHGADAFAGTINLITKNGEEIDGTNTGGRIGSFDTYDAWLQHGNSYGEWDLSVTLDMQRTGGDDDRIIYADNQTAIDIGAGTTASLAPGPLNSDKELYNMHLAAARNHCAFHWWSYLAPHSGNMGGVASALDPRGWSDEETHLLGLDYHREDLITDWDLGMRVNASYNHGYGLSVLYPPGAKIAGNTYAEGVIGNPILSQKTGGIDLSGVYEGFSSHNIRLAAGIQFQDLDTDSNRNYGAGVTPGVITNVKSGANVFLNDQHRTIWNISLQDEWAFARSWELTAGARFDHYSDFGGTFNPRLALVWETRYDLTTKFLYGRAFRPPSFNELYSDINPVARGNANLDPETIQTYEVAFDYQPAGGLRTTLSLFHYDIEDLIEQVAALRRAENTKDQEGNGFEIEVEWLVAESLRIKANYAYQRSEDKDTDEVVSNAPGNQFYANIYWNFQPQCSLDVKYNWVGNRHRDSEDTRPDIEDYDSVDLTLRRQNIGGHWEAAMAVRNLFDEDRREPTLMDATRKTGLIPGDLPLEGRSVWGEIRYSF